MMKPVFMILGLWLIMVCAVSAAPSRQLRASAEFPASRQAEVASKPVAESVEDDEEDDDDDEEVDAQSLVRAVVEEFTADSNENDDDENEEEELVRRRRRDVEAAVETMKEEQKPSEEIAEETPAKTPEETPSETPSEATAEVAATVPPPSRKPVLVLIRDAIKKVTTELPTDQVANNALQYFQLFEHFIQQTIEQVIGDDDDEEEETPAAAAAAAIPPDAEAPEGDKKPEGEQQQTQEPEKSETVSGTPEATVEEPQPTKPEVDQPQLVSSSVPVEANNVV